MLWFLNKKFPDFIQVRNTLVRVVPISIVSASVVALLNTILPQDSMGILVNTLMAIGVLVIGGLIVLPFIWTEIKLLVKL